MTIISKLASSLGRRDEEPNMELARGIAKTKDKKAVEELLDCLSNKNKDLQNNSIKVLYEAGALDPDLIAAHVHVFVALLESKNNRLQWGGMTALNTLAEKFPDRIYAHLTTLIAAAEAGSVITNDQFTGILVKLSATKKYGSDAFQLLNEQLLKSPLNQLPMYAEMALPVISQERKPLFIKTLSARLPEFEKESKKKRVEKVIRTLDRT